MLWREGVIEAELGRWPGVIEYAVRISGRESARIRALSYEAITGEAIPGDRVLLNVSALARGLGTGGFGLVVAFPDRIPPDDDAGVGHIVKARYTPQQQMFLAVDEQDSRYHQVLSTGPAAAGDLAGMPVVVADLHSALPAVIAGIRSVRPEASIGYVMTDGGALPLAFSTTVAGLNQAGWLAASVTVGQAYGGEFEAVTLHSGLLAARYAVGVDIAVVIQGPGNVGTGTAWGYSGVGAGEAVTAAWTLHGRAVAALRVSAADPRPRHRGISHHSRTAYGRIAQGEFVVPVANPTNPFQYQVHRQTQALVAAASGSARLELVDSAGLLDVLAACPVPLSTMGRDLTADPEPFIAAAAAGRLAADLLTRE
ncbi:MAG: DUF3866 family protein [Nostocoides sp.]